MGLKDQLDGRKLSNENEPLSKLQRRVREPDSWWGGWISESSPPTFNSPNPQQLIQFSRVHSEEDNRSDRPAVYSWMENEIPTTACGCSLKLFLALVRFPRCESAFCIFQLIVFTATLKEPVTKKYILCCLLKLKQHKDWSCSASGPKWKLFWWCPRHFRVGAFYNIGLICSSIPVSCVLGWLENLLRPAKESWSFVFIRFDRSELPNRACCWLMQRWKAPRWNLPILVGVCFHILETYEFGCVENSRSQKLRVAANLPN